ncbi:MAG TPA: diguanylate cyclase, partial [Acidimicrobiales bacterium]|nr:diguanylate cyclase [Acidimicrobiales bacterium]
SNDYNEYVERGGVLVQEYRVIRPDNGATVWIRDDCRMITNPGTGERFIVGVMLDVSAQKDLEQQLRTAEAKNRALIEQIPAVVWIEPLGGNPEPPFVSPTVSRFFGVERDQWFETNWWERHLHPDDRETVLEARRATIAEAGQLHTEYRMTTAGGRVIWVEEVSQVVLHDGRPWILQGLLDDVTQRKREEQQLAFRAYHDPLTGLANRPLFDESLDQALERAKRQGSEVAVLFADIDRFKQVNDQHGHGAGDEVLRVVASRLLHCARGSDVVARRGGDEYLLLLPDIGGQSGESVTERGRADSVADMMTDRIVEAMRAPIDLPSGRLVLSLSVGRCVFPWDASDGAAMMAAADAHMYGEKGRPKYSGA